MAKIKSKAPVTKKASVPQKRNRKASEPISPITPTEDTTEEESLVTERPIEFSEYLKEVKDLIGGNETLFKVISQDWTGSAKKYKGTVFGDLERGLISQCWRMRVPPQTCAGHLWLMMKNGI